MHDGAEYKSHSAGDVTAFYRLTGKNDLLVTFNCRMHDPPEPWGAALARSADYDVIGYVDYGDRWHLQQDLAPLIARFQDILPTYKRIFLYGYSMGAYAALKYSGVMGATRAFALSPQFSLDPALIGAFDTRRVREFYRPDVHGGMSITQQDLGGQCLVMYDPRYKVDAGHVAYLRKLRGIDYVVTPGLGHDTVQFMVRNKLGDLISGYFNGTTSPAAVRKGIRWHRKYWPGYKENLAQWLKNRETRPRS